MMIPKVLTNKTVMTGIQNTFLKDSLVFKPVFGDAAKMGKISGTSFPALETNVIKGGFKGNLNAMLEIAPSGLNNPTMILKKFIREHHHLMTIGAERDDSNGTKGGTSENNFSQLGLYLCTASKSDL
eukprot:CAMPEP_0119545962 /NCGR_PEP_ID=MMETSP1352-20130426/560_1 /TAXON_ID=265584 /ORGANISM="Stauroneis constricta, Strain CCMP1120" /LENGTH=126 /DNA_ID=CAMNT_0007590593 /DNA_START=59 /DNA_END=440 /DNA_ORIENTATION=-